jgi:hypothetical protein
MRTGVVPTVPVYLYSILQEGGVALPDFASPTYEELRDWWRLCRGDGEFERVIPDLVRVRQALRRMQDHADAAFDAVYIAAPALAEPGAALWRLRTDIAREVIRAGTPNGERMEVHVKPPPEIPGETPSRRRRRMRDGRT